MPSLVEIGPVVLEKKMKMLNVYDNADNNGKFSSGELKNKMYYMYMPKVKIMIFSMINLQFKKYEIFFKSLSSHTISPRALCAGDPATNHPFFLSPVSGPCWQKLFPPVLYGRIHSCSFTT